MVNQATHDARKAAHDAFDALWQSGLMRRSYCYQRLQEELGMSAEECHMAKMDEVTALKVPEIAEKLRSECLATEEG